MKSLEKLTKTMNSLPRRKLETHAHMLLSIISRDSQIKSFCGFALGADGDDDMLLCGGEEGWRLMLSIHYFVESS